MLEEQRRRIARVQRAFEILRAHERPTYDHAVRVFKTWTFEPAKCVPGAWACTGGRDLTGILAFRRDPLVMSELDLSTITGHEAYHYVANADGSHRLVQHQCSDPLCSDPAEMLADPIYAAHRALHARLRTKLASRPAAWSFGEAMLAGGAAAITVLGLGYIIKRTT
jgi:hypothetical protein